MSKFIPASEYAKKVGVSRSYIVKILSAHQTLPQIKSIEKYTNSWRIEIDDTFDALAARGDLKNYKTK
jgi:transcriptional regulator with XRE-family HTH domain